MVAMKKTLTKADIVERIYESTDKNRVDVKNTVEKLLEIMKDAIKKDCALRAKPLRLRLCQRLHTTASTGTS